MASFIASVVFALGFMVVGLLFLFWSVEGIKKEHKRSRPSTFVDILYGVLFLIGIGVLVFAVSFPKIASDSDTSTEKYRVECTEAGGVMIRLDKVGLECWEGKLSQYAN